MARKTEETTVAGVRITSPDRVLYPGQGVTKRDLAEYYVAVKDRVLPHLRGRPLTLVRCPAGQEKECFYQRRAGESTPDTVGRVQVPVDGEMAEYLVADNIRALLSLVQMGVLELHTWGARRDRLDRPDRMIYDLDPDTGLGWDAVVSAAFELRERVAALGLTAFVKTTGGKGLHVVVPLARRHTWDEVHDFSRALSEAMVRDAPDRFLAKASKQAREGKIFIDWLRNAWSASAVAAYSTRSREGAPVSTPVTWDELKAGLHPLDFTVRTVPARLAAQAEDPWAGYEAARGRLTRKMLDGLGA
jgi:bifunctional non-homologous end joining protein LigD